MAAISLYTTFSDIRAILGVSSDELDDSTLGLRVYADSLELDFIEIGESLPSAITSTEAVPLASRTQEQRTFLRLVEQFAAYAVARKVGTALPMMAKTISDGKANLSRFADAPYKAALELIDREYYRIRALLVSAFNTMTGGGDVTASTYPYLVGARATIDRVTGQ